MRSKWEILVERKEKMRNDLAVAEATLTGMEATPFTADGTGKCSRCGTALPTEAAFAKHFLVPDEQYVNLGECPTQYA